MTCSVMEDRPLWTRPVSTFLLHLFALNDVLCIDVLYFYQHVLFLMLNPLSVLLYPPPPPPPCSPLCHLSVRHLSSLPPVYPSNKPGEEVGSDFIVGARAELEALALTAARLRSGAQTPPVTLLGQVRISFISMRYAPLFLAPRCSPLAPPCVSLG